VSVDPSGLCDDCGSSLDRGQRYCLGCGSRVGSRSPQLMQLLRRVRDPRPAEESSSLLLPEHAAETAGMAGAPARSGLTLPPPRVSALLVLVFLGFGVIIGGAAGSRVDDTLAASARPPIKLILPQTASVPSTSTSPSSSSPASEPPSSEPTPTPAAEGEAEGSSTTSSSSNTSSGSQQQQQKKQKQQKQEKQKSSAPSSGGGKSGSPSGGSTSKLPPVKHVFVIMLSEQPYAAVFGPSSTAHYLAGMLEQKGELLVRYYAVAHEQLANGIALLSGQGPTPQTAQNCPTYEELTPGTSGAEEQVSGHGCVYPSSTQTLAGQLTAKHLTWKAYVEGIDEAGAAQGASGACAHPALGAADPTSVQTLPAGQSYATFRNPFVYFHAVIDSPSCAKDDVGLSALKADLKKSAKSTPSFAYIVPDRCNDGNPMPCTSGAPAGMGPADGFLQKVVPEILSSKAYKESGLLVITTDEAPSTGEFADSSSCCGQPSFPNLPPPTGGLGLGPKGGGEVGALLLSPFVKPHTTDSQEEYNHFSLLRTIEDLFALKHLGYAGSSGVKSFEASVFSAYTPG
jgi:hypothetical protein